MEEFGISRTVVREAVRILSSRGLVEARPRFRPVVRKPGYDGAVDVLSGIVPNLLTTKDGVKNLFDTRVLIEGALARQAALSAHKDIFDAILMRDPDAAEKALVEHLENAWTQVSSTFGNSEA